MTGHKIIVFDERISSLNENMFEVKPELKRCLFCGNIKSIRYKIHNVAFIELLLICDGCAIQYYGGLIPCNGTERIPVDPLLAYLEEIDPNLI